MAAQRVGLYARILPDGHRLDQARSADPLSLVRVASVMHAAGYEELPGSMRVIDALARVRDSAARWFVVRGDQGLFQGIVSLHEMRLAIAEEALARLLVLGGSDRQPFASA